MRDARALIRDPLKRWGLEDLIDSSELLVSELVTNAIKYANGEVLLRLILEPDTLVCEVHDSSPALPRVLQVDKDAENGRGLHVVSQMAVPLGRAAHRWPARSSGASRSCPRRSPRRCGPRCPRLRPMAIHRGPSRAAQPPFGSA